MPMHPWQRPCPESLDAAVVCGGHGVATSELQQKCCDFLTVGA